MPQITPQNKYGVTWMMYLVSKAELAQNLATLQSWLAITKFIPIHRTFVMRQTHIFQQWEKNWSITYVWEHTIMTIYTAWCNCFFSRWILMFHNGVYKTAKSGWIPLFWAMLWTGFFLCNWENWRTIMEYMWKCLLCPVRKFSHSFASRHQMEQCWEFSSFDLFHNKRLKKFANCHCRVKQ